MTDTVSSYDQVLYGFDSFLESQSRRADGHSFPKAKFIGIDLVASQIESARKFATATGVKNLECCAGGVGSARTLRKSSGAGPGTAVKRK